ncbi:MAG: hypothetical protein ACI4AE_00865 [Candidatus Cryptobacteroides sp.]
MDIDLLSKMVKELIMTNDEVFLPGVGSFVAEIVPASFSDKGFTINPPYRRLYFRQRGDQSNTLLVDFYSRLNNNLDKENARRIVVDFLKEMKAVLEERKLIVFPGLGRLRATKENNFFFVADEDLDIFPGGFGLERISLKSHEETPGEVSAAVAGLKELIAVPEPAAETEPVAETVTEDVAVTEAIADEVEKTAIEAAASMETTAVQAEKIAEEAAGAAEAAAEPVAETVAEAIEDSVENAVNEAVAVTETVADTVVEAVADSVENMATETAEVIGALSEATENAASQDAATGDTAEVETTEEQAEEAVQKPKKPVWKKLLTIAGIVLLAMIALILVYAIAARIFPGLFDSLLYSPDELEIILAE